MGIVQVPSNGYQMKMQDTRYGGIMEGCGDLYTRICFDMFLKKTGFSETTADIADAFVLSLYEPGNKPFYSSPDESLNIAMKFVDI